MDAVLDCLGSATMNKTELAKDAHAALNGTVGLNRIDPQLMRCVARAI